jgi:hypothetical protein
MNRVRINKSSSSSFVYDNIYTIYEDLSKIPMRSFLVLDTATGSFNFLFSFFLSFFVLGGDSLIKLNFVN